MTFVDFRKAFDTSKISNLESTRRIWSISPTIKLIKELYDNTEYNVFFKGKLTPFSRLAEMSGLRTIVIIVPNSSRRGVEEMRP